MTFTAWAVFNKDGDIMKHRLSGYYAIFRSEGDAKTAVIMGDVREVEITVRELSE